MTSEKFQKPFYKNMKCYILYAAKHFLLKTQELIHQKVILKITMPSQNTQTSEEKQFYTWWEKFTL